MPSKLLTCFRRPSSYHLKSFKQTSIRRSFITLPGTEAQTLKATRILPHKPSSIYSLIADIDAYSSFVPYCVDSKVTRWSAPDDNGKCWPSEADLTVGWGGYEETFTSRLFCVPTAAVEALSGEATPTLPISKLSHYSATFGLPNPRTSNTIFKSLSTRWNVVPLGSRPSLAEHQTNPMIKLADCLTEVHLTIEFQFANPIYAALSKAAAPRVAGIMIEAFEIQARKRFGSSSSGGNTASDCAHHS